MTNLLRSLSLELHLLSRQRPSGRIFGRLSRSGRAPTVIRRQNGGGDAGEFVQLVQPSMSVVQLRRQLMFFRWGWSKKMINSMRA